MTDAEIVKYLYDRSQVSDLLYRFAFFLDTKQWKEYIALYAEDGVMELPWITVTRQMMEAAGGPRLLMPLHATQHFSTNHQIEVTGDTARSNSYLLGQHLIRPDDQATQWITAGWYDNEYRRTATGWEITRSKITTVWEMGPRPEGAKH